MGVGEFNPFVSFLRYLCILSIEVISGIVAWIIVPFDFLSKIAGSEIWENICEETISWKLHDHQ
jgi:hypothetical protein